MTKAERYEWSEIGDPAARKMIPVKTMRVDLTYQRDSVSDSKVLWIARNWDHGAVGALTVSQREDGLYYVIDGNHRREAAVRRGDITALPCNVLAGLTVPEEARLFRLLNLKRVGVNSYTKYRSALVEGDETTVACEQMLSALGFKVHQDASPDVIAFPEALTKSFAVNPGNCKWALKICRSMVGPKEGLSKDMFRGVFYLLQHGADVERVCQRAETVYPAGGRPLIQNAIAEALLTLGKTKAHDRISAVGILKLLNHHTRNPITLGE